MRALKKQKAAMLAIGNKEKVENKRYQHYLRTKKILYKK